MQEESYQTLKETLKEYHSLALDRLMKMIPQREPKKYLYDLVKDYPNRGGKGFRPSLCIATCKALGGSLKSALNSAASLELFHNAFLVHDDVEDESLYRRGRPTLHEENGVSIAVNVGDAMNMLSMYPLKENVSHLGPYLSWKIFTEISNMVQETVEGQAIELGWRKDNICDLSENDYLNMILKKTCWYTCITPLRIGALIGTGLDIGLNRFNRFGYYMGAAFQLQDDILNLVGDEAIYGKEIGGDLLEGKRTVMLIHLLNHCTQREFTDLSHYLSLKRTTHDQGSIDWIMKLMDHYGSIEHTKKSAKNLAGAALSEFYKAFGGIQDSKDKRFLEDLILYMVQRIY